jgi:hypothetical protein
MALPFRKSGGGFLNGTAGTIVGYAFDSKVWNEGKENEYTTLSVELNIKQDGADEPVQQFLSGGFLYDTHSITDNGQELESEDDKPIIAEDSEIAKLLASAVDAGLDETPFVESNLRDLTGLVNQRFVFKREENTELVARLSKAGKPTKRKGKDGKEYRYDLLLVSEYLGEAEAPKKGAKGKAAAKTVAAAKTAKKANGAAKNAEADAQIEQAEEVLLGVLAAADAAIPRTGLSAKIVRYSTENRFSEDASEHNEIREAMRKLIGSEEFLSRENGWTFDPKGKGQPVELA